MMKKTLTIEELHDTIALLKYGKVYSALPADGRAADVAHVAARWLAAQKSATPTPDRIADLEKSKAELLAALERLVGLCGDSDGADMYALRDARAAIARARGKEAA